MTSRVVVVGDVMLDVVVRPLTAVAPTSDTPSRIRVGRGGSAASLAVSLARSGHEVRFVGAAGRDGPAGIVRAALERGGVRVEIEEVSSTTGTVVAMVAEDGQRAMLTDRGANSSLSEAFVLQSLASSFDHLHVSGYLLLDSSTRAVARAALDQARERGSTTSIDVCSVAPLTALTPQVFLQAADGATYLFANEEEALTLSAAQDVTGALDYLVSRFEEVVVTRGDQGALASRGDLRAEVAALDAVAVDTTGAGDAATGAYLGARLRHETIEVALEAAMAAGARAVEELGAN